MRRSVCVTAVLGRGWPISLRAGPSGLALLAIVVPATILAAVGYVSLRQWGLSTELLFRLRRKFEADPDHPAYILTAHGQGYKFTAS